MFLQQFLQPKLSRRRYLSVS